MPQQRELKPDGSWDSLWSDLVRGKPVNFRGMKRGTMASM